MLKAAFSGSFDPPSYGHLDIIERASALFDELLVVVAENRQKNSLFSIQERMDMVSELVKPWKNVSVESCNGLMVDFIRKRDIKVLVRGIRGVNDFSHEFDLALWNKKLDQEVETLFMSADPRYCILSSSALKELASFRGDLSALAPPLVTEALGKKVKK
jgi:pantetheine-phosphate adenylyltransferase